MELVGLGQNQIQAQDLLVTKDEVVFHKLPVQNRQQMVSQLQQAITTAGALRQTYADNQKTKFSQNVFQRLDNLKIYDYSKIWKFDKNKLSSLSIFALMRNIILEQMKKVIQIEFEIDIFSKQFIKMPSKIFVHQFVIEFMKQKSMYNMFDYYYQNIIPSNSSEMQILKIKMALYYPLLTFCYNVLEKQFGFMININAATQIIFNPFDDLLLTQIEDIKSYQSSQIIIGIQKYIFDETKGMITSESFASTRRNLIVKNTKQCLVGFINKRKLIKKNKHFFAIMKQNQQEPDLAKMAKQAFETEQKAMHSTSMEEKSFAYDAFGKFEDMMDIL